MRIRNIIGKLGRGKGEVWAERAENGGPSEKVEQPEAMVGETVSG